MFAAGIQGKQLSCVHGCPIAREGSSAKDFLLAMSVREQP